MIAWIGWLLLLLTVASNNIFFAASKRLTPSIKNWLRSINSSCLKFSLMSSMFSSLSSATRMLCNYYEEVGVYSGVSKILSNLKSLSELSTRASSMELCINCIIFCLLMREWNICFECKSARTDLTSKCLTTTNLHLILNVNLDPWLSCDSTLSLPSSAFAILLQI